MINIDGIEVEYFKNIVPNPDFVFAGLMKLDWVQRENTPRKEYYCSLNGKPYTYGRGAGVRTYEAQVYTPLLTGLTEVNEEVASTNFDVLFLNRYDANRDQLGWHADDSPEMDDARPISIMTFGSEREIWFTKKNGEKIDKGAPVTKVLLENNSILLMPPGLQDSHMHRIPKSPVQDIGTRISLTFRGYVEPA